MLIVDIILVLALVFGALHGHKKGLVGIVVGFAALILSIVLAFAFQGVVADAIYDTGIGTTVKEAAQENMQKMIDNGENVEDSFYGSIISNAVTEESLETTAEGISRFAMKGLSFIVIFFIVRIICYILQMILNVVFDLPILKTINGTGGTVVGVISVLIKVWILLAFILFIAPLPMFEGVSAFIDGTILVKLLYNNNILVALIKAGLGL